MHTKIYTWYIPVCLLSILGADYYASPAILNIVLCSSSTRSSLRAIAQTPTVSETRVNTRNTMNLTGCKYKDHGSHRHYCTDHTDRFHGWIYTISASVPPLYNTTV